MQYQTLTPDLIIQFIIREAGLRAARCPLAPRSLLLLLLLWQLGQWMHLLVLDELLLPLLKLLLQRLHGCKVAGFSHLKVY